MQMYKKYNWQRAGPQLATCICTACVEGRQVDSRELLHAFCVANENEFGRFNSNPKPPNLIPRQFSGYAV